LHVVHISVSMYGSMARESLAGSAAAGAASSAATSGAFTVAEGQTGAMFAIGGRLIGLEVFEHPEMLRKMLSKIVRSYALDAMHQDDDHRALSKQSIEGFLAEIAGAEVQRFPAVGSGEDLRLTSKTITGAALVEGGHVVHLCAFRVAQKS
jgi:hypothetical protein